MGMTVTVTVTVTAMHRIVIVTLVVRTGDRRRIDRGDHRRPFPPRRCSDWQGRRDDQLDDETVRNEYYPAKGEAELTADS